MTVEQQINQANEQVMDILLRGQPVWVDVVPAIEAIPGMTKNTVFHPGPPYNTPDEIPYPIQTSVCGALMHEKLAATREEAWQLVKDGKVNLCSSQDYCVANAASMVTSASMPVIVVEDKVFGGRGYAPLHPGSNPKCLRWGLYDEEVEADLTWFDEVYGPALGKAVRASGGIDVKTILSKTAGMGDENHNRQPAASMALALTLIPWLVESDIAEKEKVVRAIAANDRFFLHVMMAGVESLTVNCKKIPMSTVMVGMGANGVRFGIQIAATGNQWHTDKAPMIDGIFLKPTTTKDDVLGYLGDSCVTEVYGLGGMSAIAGPAYLRMTGAGYDEALERTEKARAVSLGEHTFAPVPWNDFRGFPVGVDARKVVGKNIRPISHGGSALKAGGQAGAGACDIPMEPFKKSLIALYELITGEKA